MLDRTYVGRGFLWGAGSKLASAAAQLGFLGILARQLGPQPFGSYAVLLSVVTVASFLAPIGGERLASVTIPRALQDNEGRRLRSVLRYALLAPALPIILSTIVVLSPLGYHMLAGVLADTPRPWLPLWLSLLFAFKTYEVVISGSLRGFREYRLSALLAGPLANALTLVLLLLWLALPITLDTIAAALAAHSLAVLPGILLGLAYIRRLTVSSALDDIGEHPSFFTHARSAIPFAVQRGLEPLHVQADLWIVSAFVSGPTVGFYAAASRIVHVAGTARSAIGQLAPPVFSRLHATQRHQALEHTARLCSTAVALPTIAVLGACAIAPGPILALVYDDPFSAGGSLLTVLALGRILAVLPGLGAEMLNSTSNQQLTMRVHIATTIAALSLASLAAWAYGAFAVALVASISLGVQTLLLAFYVRSRLSLYVHPSPVIATNGIRRALSYMARSR